MRTLKYACKKFVEHLKATGTKEITASNYWRILQLFIDYLGPEKNIEDITVRNVSDFYRSKPATHKTRKDGTMVPRAETSYLQIKRDVRLCLCWFHEQGWISSVPLPPDERRFLESRPDKSEKKSESKTVKTLKADGCENITPITEPDSDATPVAIAEPPEIVQNAVSEPGMDEDTSSTHLDGQDADTQQKLTLL